MHLMYPPTVRLRWPIQQVLEMLQTSSQAKNELWSILVLEMKKINEFNLYHLPIQKLSNVKGGRLSKIATYTAIELRSN